ncbi:MAG TPA: hypothetical protein VGA59_14680, partial [Ramlibacter sp.]
MLPAISRGGGVDFSLWVSLEKDRTARRWEACGDHGREPQSLKDGLEHCAVHNPLHDKELPDV